MKDLVRQFEELKASAANGVTPAVKNGLDRLIGMVDETILPAISAASEADRAQAAEISDKLKICDISNLKCAERQTISNLQGERSELKTRFDAAVVSGWPVQGNTLVIGE